MKNLFLVFLIGTSVSLGCKFQPKQQSPELLAREKFAERMDEKWNLPGKGYIAAFYATGNDKKILSVSMSPRIEKFTEPSVYELLDKKEWQEAKKLGFEKMEVRHSDLTNTNLNF